ncbi:7-carboxy-7-deazaguanine synthase [Halomonas denitrificans]|uniref:7-carboxy-7-deazaguanine synthase n=1 Tax=Halomonas TaxID=2745 RepID=UPI001A8D2F68|nr:MULTISPECIES: 7-carboxy-7-deazaguanine synthase [Halomonas]MBN8411070.1 7-carboxy-7-deazaguanine synthase [Halomonas litopenaei]MBY5970517.1 7-carboxy-7-deazaguanine synthase [Halomonas denitrificans]MCA0973827.1 7-carboxy-7-deazaguanine synthase [Halomonas denitrificans]MED5294875.1 7-carboxy-7-deazaguanine synthase [Pseudomonadota bacterium]
MYSVKEAFYTLQGEGVQAGRASVFCRFTGCNLWSGREQDRASAQCHFCDTDFVGTDGQNGGKFSTAEALTAHLASLWPHSDSRVIPYVVFTGGEPLLQLDTPLIEAMHRAGFEIGVETNGTLPAPEGIDWLCVSPKGAAPLAQRHGDELKLVFPQAEAPPEAFEAMQFDHFLLQPMDTSLVASDAPTTPLQATVAHCMAHPRWRLSLQTHKIAGID